MLDISHGLGSIFRQCPSLPVNLSNAIQVRKEKFEEANVCPKITENSEKEVKWHPNGEGIDSMPHDFSATVDTK